MRNMLFRLFPAAALALVLTGCSSDKLTKVDDALSSDNVQTGITLACATYTGIKAGYDAYAIDNPVSDKTAKIIETAVAGVDEICRPPYPASTNEVIAKVTRAGVAVYNALMEAKRATASAG